MKAHMTMRQLSTRQRCYNKNFQFQILLLTALLERKKNCFTKLQVRDVQKGQNNMAPKGLNL